MVKFMRCFSNLLSSISCLIIVMTSCLLPAAELTSRPAFPLQNGDLWVMAGDSITAQHLHSNYFEAFCYARYPNLKFAFRNSGVGGHTIPTTLARFDYDIAAWKPTVVSVELGMNDKGSIPPDRFMGNMNTMVERIRAVNARPVIFSASPVNNGETLAKLGVGNQRLGEYADQLAKFCAEEKIPYADQFHRLVDVWGKNKPRELLANSLPVLREMSRDEALAGIQHLRSFLAAQVKDSRTAPISMQGDPVHPGPAGQLMMAAELLNELGAERFVSSATFDASGKVVETKECAVTNVVLKDGVLTFERLDQRLPIPVPEAASGVLNFHRKTILDISQYLLKVTGLNPGLYTLKINGIVTQDYDAKDLDAGINLTSCAAIERDGTVNPIAAQGRAILSAVAAKEELVDQWRKVSRLASARGAAVGLTEQLQSLNAKVEEADAKIREAAVPQKLNFEIVPNMTASTNRVSLWNGQAPIGDGKLQAEDAFITVHTPAVSNGTAIVICPGGGYGGLVTGAEGHGIAKWLNGHGITGIVLEYRLPAGRSYVPLYDAQRAIRMARAKSKEWNIDASKIGIMGFSAGGHLASTAGTHFDAGDKAAADPVSQVSSRPDFMVLIYPVVSLTEKGHQGSRQNLLGKDPTSQLVHSFSNEKQVTAQTPPAFLAHAIDDKAVTAENSKMLYEALQANKVASKYLELPSGGHGLNGYQGPMWEAWKKQSLEFLAEQKLIPDVK
jgi:acetyl esterase/lipase/lysophospholipase L1-like esterase